MFMTVLYNTYDLKQIITIYRMFVVNQYVFAHKKDEPAKTYAFTYKASNYITNIHIFIKATCLADLRFLKKLSSACFFVLGFAIC